MINVVTKSKGSNGLDKKISRERTYEHTLFGSGSVVLKKVTFINPLVYDNKKDFIKKLKSFVMDESPFIETGSCKMIDYVLLFQKFGIFKSKNNIYNDIIKSVEGYSYNSNFNLRDVVGQYPDFKKNINIDDSNFIYYDQKRQFLMVNFSYIGLYFYQNNVSDALKTLKNILNLFGEYFERYLKETVSNNDELVSFLNEEE